MGEAKRRGTYIERVNAALQHMVDQATRQKVRAQMDLQEHLQRLEARRAKMEQQMGPMDKLYVDQQRMVQSAADKMKRLMADNPIKTPMPEQETSERGCTSCIQPVDEVAVIETLGDGVDTQKSEVLEKLLDASDVIIVLNDTSVVTVNESSHFDDLLPFNNGSAS